MRIRENRLKDEPESRNSTEVKNYRKKRDRSEPYEDLMRDLSSKSANVEGES